MSYLSDTALMGRQKPALMLLKLRKSLAKALKEKNDSLQSNLSFYDLNELPYVSQMRTMMLIMCASTFIIAPIAYLPLGHIQAAYDQKCFLYTDLRVRTMINSDNKSVGHSIIALDAVATDWGPTSSCDITTFVPVFMSIFSIIMGMSTFTIWPTMMALGRGGALMMSYTILQLLSLASCTTSIVFLYSGYRDTCENLRYETRDLKQGGFSCESLNNIEIVITEIRQSRIAKNVHRAMVVAEIIHWCLLGLMFGKVCISVATFGIIWFYVNSK